MYNIKCSFSENVTLHETLLKDEDGIIEFKHKGGAEHLAKSLEERVNSHSIHHTYVYTVVEVKK